MWLNTSLTSQIWAGASLSSWCNPCGVTFLTLLVWGLTPVPFSWFGAYSSYYEWWRRKKSELPSPGSVLEPGQRKRPDSCGSLAWSLSRSGCGGEVVCGPGSVQGGSPGGLIPLLPKPFFSFLFDASEVTWEGHLLGEVFQACLTWWRPPGQTQDVLERFMSVRCFGNAFVWSEAVTTSMWRLYLLAG